jgi:hypothetical protein
MLEVLIDVALGVVGTSAPEVLGRFASVWRVESRYMGCFLMLSITISSLYSWKCFQHVAQGYSSLDLAHPACLRKRQTETGKGDCYRVVMAWEKVSSLKTISYGSNQPAAGNSRQT